MSDLGDRALDLAVTLVEIDSVNPALESSGAGERGVVAHLRARLDAAGFTTTEVPAAGDGRPSLVAVPRGTPAGPTVLLNGHLDTVGVTGMPDPFGARVEDGRLLGRGAADMKGGVAALVVACEQLVADAAPVHPVLALVADEEDASRGSEAVIAALPALGVRPGACLVAEPTDLAPARSLRGVAVVEVAFPGKAAHSSQPEHGTNAVTHLGRFLAAVDAAAPDVRATGGDLMVTLARGGTSTFVVPDHASCSVERRTVPGQDAAHAVDEVRALLDPVWGATATLVAHRPAWRLDTTGPAADLAGRLGAVLGTAATFDAPYWMEAPLWQQVAPTVVCGPSGGGLHAVDEWLDVAQLRAYVEALVGVLGSPGPWGARGH